jgi:hypothetical protein
MSVHAALGFLPNEELFRHERPYCLKFEPPEGLRRTNIQAEYREHIIEDIRGHEEDFNMDKNGFALVPFHTRMTFEDFESEDKILAVYMPEVAGVIQRLVGAFRVQVFEYVASALYKSDSRIEKMTECRFASSTKLFRSQREGLMSIISPQQWFILVRANKFFGFFTTSSFSKVI